MSRGNSSTYPRTAFSGDVDDPDVRAAFNEKVAEVNEAIDITAILLARRGTWSEEQMAALAVAPVEEYHSALKAHSGPELLNMLSNVFQYDRVINVIETMRKFP
jgi:hypothetical protein